ncbi:MAG: hypothetical protein K2X48_04975 [Chitinophagaceae bacterium]|nr:hypothetical protein [Chitinophagaceae bacterium]
MKQWMHLLLLVLPFTISAQTTKRTAVETKMEKVTVFLKGVLLLNLMAKRYLIIHAKYWLYRKNPYFVS